MGMEALIGSSWRGDPPGCRMPALQMAGRGDVEGRRGYSQEMCNDAINALKARERGRGRQERKRKTEGRCEATGDVAAWL